MSYGDWLLLLFGTTAVVGTCTYTIGKYVGRQEARPCQVCRDAERPRHDIHGAWRCVDNDGCQVRIQRARPPQVATGAAEAVNRWLGAVGQEAVETESPSGTDETMVDAQEATPAYTRLLDDL